MGSLVASSRSFKHITKFGQKRAFFCFSRALPPVRALPSMKRGQGWLHVTPPHHRLSHHGSLPASYIRGKALAPCGIRPKESLVVRISFALVHLSKLLASDGILHVSAETCSLNPCKPIHCFLIARVYKYTTDASQIIPLALTSQSIFLFTKCVSNDSQF